ncbi:MAG: Clp protease ClpP [Bacteroidetes bacterium]|nr:Clp protease ClpP [Bacteroidota bacterium]
MSKLLVNITSEGTTGRVEIIGSISEWGRNNAIDFREKCVGLKTSGVTDVTVYLMTGGGECMQASEIVNILNESFGKYKAEGGALVASAGTYIAVCAEKFIIAKNGQIMIHKPSAWIDGNETEVENQLSLLKNITADYLAKYEAKLKKSKEDFLAKWNAGDFWLSATEAVEWGFADEIKEPQKLDAKTEKFVSAFVAGALNNQNNQTMTKLTTLLVAALALEGINEQSTDEQIVAAVQSKFNTVKAQSQAQTDNAIKAMLDKAQAEGKIFASNGKKVEDIRATYENVGKTAGIEALTTILGGLQSPQPITSQLNGEGKGAATGEFKTFADLQAKGETFMLAFKAENKDAYNALYKAEFGHEPRI